MDIDDMKVREVYHTVSTEIIMEILDLFKQAGDCTKLANSVGAVFDQVVWLMLADMAGNRYFDHITHMHNKSINKVGKYTCQVLRIRELFKLLPIDARIDLFGLNKLSVYPQVCAYQVVIDQHEKHTEPWDCSFAKDTDEDLKSRVTRDECLLVPAMTAPAIPGLLTGRDWRSRERVRTLVPKLELQ